MRVLQINLVCGNGSTGKIAVDIADLLNDSGGDAYIAYGFGETDYPKSYKIPYNWENWLERMFFFKVLGLGGRGTILATAKFLRWVDTIKPDIIHLHNIHGYYINYSLLFKYINVHNIPVVWTMHDCWSITGGCCHFSGVGCEKWKTECRNCSYYGTYHGKSVIATERSTFLFKMKLFNSVENLTIVPVSHWLECMAKESFMKDRSIYTIQNGIDLTVFRRKDSSSLRIKLGIPLNRKIILGVSSIWSDDKGLREMIKLSELPDSQVILVGQNIGHPFPTSIIAIDRTNNQDELADYYSLADVFVNPTYNDSFPTVNIEALACGTPVVTYDTDGSPEIVDDTTGLVVPKGDTTALILAVKDVLSTSNDNLSSVCRVRAEYYFDKKINLARYIDLYRSIISQHYGHQQ